jgi:hypothetical protein
LLTVVVLGATLAGWYGAGSSIGSTRSQSAFHSVLVATLTGKAEAGAGSSTGYGTARITLNLKTGKACWNLSVKRLDTTLSAHVHKAPPGKTGPVVIPLGARFSAKGCVTAPDRSLRAVGTHPGSYYVNVHTKRFLNGAIRGRLRVG